MSNDADRTRQTRPLYLSMEEASALRRAPGWDYCASGGESHSWERIVNGWRLELWGRRRPEGWCWTLWVWRDGHRLDWVHDAVKAETPAGAMRKAEAALKGFLARQAEGIKR